MKVQFCMTGRVVAALLLTLSLDNVLPGGSESGREGSPVYWG